MVISLNNNQDQGNAQLKNLVQPGNETSTKSVTSFSNDGAFGVGDTKQDGRVVAFDNLASKVNQGSSSNSSLMGKLNGSNEGNGTSKSIKLQKQKFVPPGQAKKIYGQNMTGMKSYNKAVDKMESRYEKFADKAEGKDQGFVNFGFKLRETFSGINRAFGNQSNGNVGHRLGMAQMNKETISQLFNNGDGNGDFNAVRFISSLSNNINDALYNYKESMEEDKADEKSKVDGIIA